MQTRQRSCGNDARRADSVRRHAYVYSRAATRRSHILSTCIMPPATPKPSADASPSSPIAVEAATFDAVARDVPGPSVSEHGAQDDGRRHFNQFVDGVHLSSVNGKTPSDELMGAHQKPIESLAELKALLDRLPPGADAKFGAPSAWGQKPSEQLFSEEELSVGSETLRSHLSTFELPALPHSLRPTLDIDPRLQLTVPFGAVVVAALIVRLSVIGVSRAMASSTRRAIEHMAKRASRRQSAPVRSEFAFSELGDGCLAFTNSAIEDRYRRFRLSNCYRQVAAGFVLLSFLDFWMLLSALLIPAAMTPDEHTLLSALGAVSGLYRLCSGCALFWLYAARPQEKVERSWTRIAQLSSPVYCALFCLFLPRASPAARPYQATYAIEAGARLRFAFGGRMENCIIIILIFGALGTRFAQLSTWALFLAADVCSQLAELRGRTRWIREQLTARVKRSQPDAHYSSGQAAHGDDGATTGPMRSLLPRIGVAHQTLLASLVAIVASRAFCIGRDEDTIWAGFMSALALAAVCLAVAAYRLPLRHYVSVWLCFLPSWALFTWSYMLILSEEEFAKIWHNVQFKPTPIVLNLLFGLIHGSFPRRLSWSLLTYTCCYLAPDMLLGGVVNLQQLGDGASTHVWLQFRCIQVPTMIGIIVSSLLRETNARLRRHENGGAAATEKTTELEKATEVEAVARRRREVINELVRRMRAETAKTRELEAGAEEATEAEAVAEKDVESRAMAEQLTCPITMELMRDPVITADGHTYERSAIQSWMQTNVTSPLTGEPLEHHILTPNHIVRGLLRQCMRKEGSQ